MADIKNPLSNLSYTSKDFQTIYPELLDLVKKLTYRWDPSISNESDPGVILLKLNAIIADKNDYNIDKNILETFPLSVTQESNARQLFEQLGYNMHWYRGAETTVTLRWVGEEAAKSYAIPRFTMVCDDEGTNVYTITNIATLIQCNNATPVTVNAIQGIIVDYDLNGKTVIKLSDLDENNRLYFNDQFVAENGIFINNTISADDSSPDNADWKRVDNLVIQSLYDDNNQPNKIFKFGVSPITNDCYVEFPENIDELIGDGLRIKYLKTSGANGNVIRGAINDFYEEITIQNPSDSSDTIQLTTDSVIVFNNDSTNTGKDSESIDSAYSGYLKTIGTFNTLVTLRDYLNAILNSELVSNGFVCDRTNDIQNCYFIMHTNDANITAKELMITQTSGQPSMDPFSLKLYLLEYSGNVNSRSEFNKTFTLQTDTSAVELYIEELKSIQHDYQALERGEDNPCFFKNKYTLEIIIVPQTPLTLLQQTQVRSNVEQALFNAFNARQIKFGQTLEYNDLSDVISKADERIKTLVLKTPSVATYYGYIDDNGIYKESDDPVSLEIDSSTGKLPTDTLSNVQNTIFAKSVLAGVTPIFKTESTPLIYQINQNSDIADALDPSLTEDNPITSIKKLEVGMTLTMPFISSDTDPAVSELDYEGKYDSRYTLKDNESIIITNPSLRDKAVYGNYVKYECNFACEKGKDYQLDTGEYIIFYWKQSDEDTNYSYAAYGIPSQNATGQLIIKSTFDLIPITILGTNKPAFSIEGKKGIITNSTDNTTIYSNTTAVLTSKKTIAIREPNQTVLNRTINGENSKLKFYWFTNNKVVDENSNEQYQLSFTNNTYVLKDNELFLYTEDMQNIVMLGSGTKLTIDAQSTPIVWQVPVVSQSSTDIAQQGNTSITVDDWMLFADQTDTDILTILELAINAISGPNSEMLLITKNTTQPAASEIYTGTPQTFDSTKFDLYYRSVDSQNQPLTSWTLISLPDIGDITIQTQVNINCSPDYPQLFWYDTRTNMEGSSGQTNIYSFKINDGDLETVESPAIGSDYRTISILPDVYLFGAGIASADTLLSASGKDDITLYLYESLDLQDIGVTVNATNNAVIDTSIAIGDNSKTVTLADFQLPVGTYILPIQRTKSNASITISVGDIESEIDTALETIDGLTEITDDEIHYFLLEAEEGVSGINFIFTIPSAASAAVAVQAKISTLQKIETSSILSDAQLTSILNKMQQLDINHRFDYTYIPDPQIKIENPLSANTFLNPNHIFNKFTISQIDTIDTEITNSLMY